MRTTVKTDGDESVEDHTSFTIQVCSSDGRLLDEYTLSRLGDNVATLDAAEGYVRDGFSDYQGDALVVFVSQETLTKFRQLQIKVEAKKQGAA